MPQQGGVNVAAMGSLYDPLCFAQVPKIAPLIRPNGWAGLIRRVKEGQTA